MTDSPDIVFNVAGQLLWFDAPEGRPTVTAVAVFEDDNDDTQTEEFATTGTVESVNTTVDGASGAAQQYPHRVSLTSVVGIVRGRQYLLTNGEGEREWIEVASIDAANRRVTARSPIHGNYEITTSTFQGTRITAPVDNTWVADRVNLSDPRRVNPRYRAHWSYTVGGNAYSAATYFDHVRYPFQHTVTAPDVEAFAPGWLARLPTDDRVSQGERVIKESARQVKEDLRKRRMADYGQRNSEALNGLVVRMACYLGADAAYMHGSVSRDYVDYSNAKYNAFLSQIIDTTTQQATADGAAAATPSSPLWNR